MGSLVSYYDRTDAVHRHDHTTCPACIHAHEACDEYAHPHEPEAPPPPHE